MKIVLDTNQLIAGILWPNGPAGFILECWRKGGIEPVISLEIIDELERVLTDKFDYGRESADYLRRTLAFHATLVEPVEKINAVRDDPSDKMFLEAAAAGGAQFIVSRDKHLLKLLEFRGIKIIPPEEFARKIRQSH
ncbi:putative toxin-antitoxin system toxin component, PIN family [Candidatus Micrarchaeota archaeon]|nr:putative toxin-antitoxin system toxin component, PIN family [Candidatus Micrarchaeota archaeon]